MFVVAIRVLALALLALGLWQLAETLYQADRHLWLLFASPPVSDLEPLTSNGVPVADVRKHLIERGCYSAAIIVIALGFGYIGRRLAQLSAGP